MFEVKFKIKNGEWEEIFEDTVKVLLFGYFSKNEIKNKINNMKCEGKYIETLACIMRYKEIC